MCYCADTQLQLIDVCALGPCLDAEGASYRLRLPMTLPAPARVTFQLPGTRAQDEAISSSHHCKAVILNRNARRLSPGGPISVVKGSYTRAEKKGCSSYGECVREAIAYEKRLASRTPWSIRGEIWRKLSSNMGSITPGFP